MEMQNLKTAATAEQSRAAFSCEPKQLAEAVAFLAKRVIERGHAAPILSHVLISAHPAGTITLTGTDLDIWAAVSIPAAVESPGAFCTDARALSDAVAKLAKGGAYEVQISELEPESRWNGSAGPERASITASGSRASLALKTLPAADFPAPTDEAEGDGTLSRFTVPAARFLADMATVGLCVSTEERRRYLNGVAFQVREMAGRACLNMAATDGLALAASSRPLPAGAETLPDCILWRKAPVVLGHAGKLAGAIKAIDVEFEASIHCGGRFRFDLGTVTVWSKGVEAVFPEWERAFETSLAPTDGEPALFPDLLPARPTTRMDKLAKAAGGSIAWQDSNAGYFGTVPGDGGLVLGIMRADDSAEPVKGFRYQGLSVEIEGDQSYPIAEKGGRIHLTADQVRRIVGDSVFETMEITMPDGSRAHILAWLWRDGASRFLTVRPDGRTYAGGRYVTRAEIEAGPVAEAEPHHMPEIPAPAAAQGECVPEPVQEVPEAPEALSGPEIAPTDPIEALAARIEALEARLASLPMESEPVEAAAPIEEIERGIESPPVMGVAIISRKRSPAHERAIRRAWAERRARRIFREAAERATNERDLIRAGWQAEARMARREIAGLEAKRRRAVMLARQRGKEMAKLAAIIHDQAEQVQTARAMAADYGESAQERVGELVARLESIEASMARHKARGDTATEKLAAAQSTLDRLADEIEAATLRAVKAETALAAVKARSNGWPPAARPVAVNVSFGGPIAA